MSNKLSHVYSSCLLKKNAIWNVNGLCAAAQRVISQETTPFSFLDSEEPLTVFLIDAVSEQKIEYQIIFADEAPADWIRDADLAGSGPKIKLGEIYENSEDL